MSIAGDQHAIAEVAGGPDGVAMRAATIAACVATIAVVGVRATVAVLAVQRMR